MKKSLVILLIIGVGGLLFFMRRDPLIEQARQQIKETNYIKAVEVLKKKLEASPHHIEAHKLMAEALFSMKSYEAFLEIANHLKQLNKGKWEEFLARTAESYYALGNQALQNGGLEEAKTYFGKIRELGQAYPRHPVLMPWLAEDP